MRGEMIDGASRKIGTYAVPRNRLEAAATAKHLKQVRREMRKAAIRSRRNAASNSE